MLKLRELYPDDSSGELAQVLSPLLERRLSPNAVRIMLHDARVAFARALWRAAQTGCAATSSDEVQEFLEELGIWRFVSGCGSTGREMVRSPAAQKAPRERARFQQQFDAQLVVPLRSSNDDAMG